MGAARAAPPSRGRNRRDGGGVGCLLPLRDRRPRPLARPGLAAFPRGGAPVGHRGARAAHRRSAGRRRPELGHRGGSGHHRADWGQFLQRLLDSFGFKDPIVRGMSTAASAHGLGTAALAAKEPDALPFCALAYALIGISASVLATVPAVQAALIALAG